MLVLHIFLAIPVVVIVTQLYLYAISRKGVARQGSCRKMGITFASLGVVSLALHNVVIVFLGFYLIMIGLLLMANGLDRLDKRVYIDRYNDDSGENKP